MKVLLTALNAKYVHMNLAIRYLKKMVEDVVDEAMLKEFTINHSVEYIVSEIYQYHPDVLCFSSYIWNIEMIHHITKLIKKVMPNTIIILGGPEVSFETKKLMEENDAIDIVVIGEGENTFRYLIKAIEHNEDYSLISNIAFRARGNVFLTELCNSNLSMDELPFPYEQEELQRDKIIYYESSRGCPFNCQYCLSSTVKGVRFLSLERVKKEIKYFIDQEVKQVKFVDRTFNAKKQYALEIMDFIKQHNKGKTNFHFEVTADLLDDDMLEFLKDVPVGLFQFEIGVQSTNPLTLKSIDRKTDFQKLSNIVRSVSSGKNIHQHLDLIVGLPEEDYFSFRQSFDDVFRLRPEKLQLGFLKLLKGSGLREKSRQYGYIYSEYAPYEVLESHWLSYGEIIKLKGIEEMVETYWNSGIFKTSIETIISTFYKSSFKFFEDLWNYWREKGYHHISHGKNRIYEILLEFYSKMNFDRKEMFNEVLKFDYIKNAKSSSLPSVFNRFQETDFKNKCHQFLQKEENLMLYLPDHVNIPAKQIIKKVHFEQFVIDVIDLEEKDHRLDQIEQKIITVLFDYEIENKALEDCKYYKVSLNQ